MLSRMQASEGKKGKTRIGKETERSFPSPLSLEEEGILKNQAGISDQRSQPAKSHLPEKRKRKGRLFSPLNQFTKRGKGKRILETRNVSA